MSPEEYSRLSPTDKKRLWLERKHDRTFQRRIRRKNGKSFHMRQRLWFLVGVVVLSLTAPFWEKLWDKIPVWTTEPAPVESGWSTQNIQFDEVASVPRAAIDPADREWAEGRQTPIATETAAAPSGGGERLRFGLCVWGGGTNCVVDGDTIYLHGTKIRIAGIDAPETHDFKCAGEKARGDQATARLRALLNSGAITLASIDRDEDRYGRKLRNVAVNGQDVGDVLVSESLARPYRGYKMGWC